MRVFPALSRALSTSVCAPSPFTVIEEHDPSGLPSSVHVKLVSPDVVSEAEPLKLIESRYQPFRPAMPLQAPVIFGNWESTFADNVPISELSRKEERAQYARTLSP